MVLYAVRHKNRSKEIEIDIHPGDEWKISRKTPGFLMEILKVYKKKAGYAQFIHYSGLEFQKIQTAKEIEKNQLQDFAEPCDKDWCNACRKGDYHLCPNK